MAIVANSPSGNMTLRISGHRGCVIQNGQQSKIVGFVKPPAKAAISDYGFVAVIDEEGFLSILAWVTQDVWKIVHEEKKKFLNVHDIRFVEKNRNILKIDLEPEGQGPILTCQRDGTWI